MDRVKFGRALGYGARHAAKTLTQAVDAASAPNPANQQVSGVGSTPQPGQRVTSTRLPDARTVRAAGRQAKSSVVKPIVRFSSVIWLQLTGVFFGLIAVTMGSAAWRARAGLHAAASSQPGVKVYAYIALCALFTYFTVSSLVRASRR